MARLAIDRDFLRDLVKLERSVQNRVDEVFAKFQAATHAGLHLEPVQNARDHRMHTIRITQFWRGVVLAPETGDLYTLLKVLPHDDAYQWAVRRQATVNAATGRIELRDVDAIAVTYPELSKMAEAQPSRLFDHVGDADLSRLGIDEQTLRFARALTDLIQLEASKAFLPGNQWDALYGLAAGLTPEEVWAELGAASTGEPVDTKDLEAAVGRSGDHIVLVDGPEELLAVFRASFALWRIYLHPTQHRMANSTFSGPARVTGGPGTGKTVVSLHRAHHLATEGAGPVLVTTFTSTLAKSLEAGYALLADDETRARVEIRHVDQLANQVFAERHGRPVILSGAEEKEIWRQVIRGLELPFSEAFLYEEWRQVILAQRVTTAAEYLDAKRAGRGRRLGPRQKALLWQGVCEFTDELIRRGTWTYETVCVEATRLLAEREDKPYRHIVVDEAQDLSPMQWRLLRAAAPPGPDDLFIAGDTHQRIYHHRVSLRDVGISVTGRSSRLTVNYRTTAEILAWSLGMLRGERIDDMDDGLETIVGSRSDMHGELPTLAGFPTRQAEMDGVAVAVACWITAGVAPEEIGVAARSNWLADAAKSALIAKGVPVHALARSDQETGVAVGTMHRMKGLEFRCVAVVGIGDQHMPERNAVTPIEEDEVTHQHDLQRERCLLFVACTRARERLRLSWHATPSRFLTAVDGSE